MQAQLPSSPLLETVHSAEIKEEAGKKPKKHAYIFSLQLNVDTLKADSCPSALQNIKLLYQAEDV